MVNGAFSVLVRRGFIAGAGALMVVAAAGCGASGHAASSGTAKAATASPKQTTASPSPSVTLDGSALVPLLLPGSAMPAGYRPYPGGARNGAQALPQDMPQPVPVNKACGMLNTTGWIQDGGISTADFASSDYWNSSRTAEIYQEIDVFQSGDAATVMSRLWGTFGQCRTFTQQVQENMATTSVTRARLAGVGDQAIKAVETSPAYYGGETLVAIEVGDAVVTCLDSSPGSDNGVAAVTMAERVAQRVRAALQAG